MEQKFIIIQPEGIMPLYHRMKLADKVKDRIITSRLSGTYIPPHFVCLLIEINEQLTILYN